MKLLRMRMMIKPYICLIGGNLLNGGGGGGGGGGGVFSRQQQQLVQPPPSSSSTSSSSSSSKHKHKINKHKHIKVIKPDGMVTIFNRRIKACEVMNEYPKHMVCRSDSLYIGQIIPHLSQQDKLEKGHTYFLLPSHIFHSVLSFVTIASSFASPPPPPPPQNKSSSSPSSSSDVDGEKKQNSTFVAATAALNVKKKAAAASSNLLKRSSSSPAFDIQKTTSGTLRIRVSEVFLSQLIMEQQQQDNKDEDDDDKHQLLCTTPQLHKDYKQLVMDSRVRHWKPKLEMISELKDHKKRKTRLSSASFSINNKTKTKSSANNKSNHQSSLPAATTATKCQSACKLRRFKLKLQGLTTTTTNNPSCRYPPKYRNQH